MKTADKVGMVAGVLTALGSIIFVAQYQRYGQLSAIPVAVGVQDAATKEPVQFATVQVGSQVQVSDDIGETVFNGVLPGTLTITVVAEGYESVSEAEPVDESTNSFLVSLTPSSSG
jgi:hypothetical protein